MLYSFRRFEVLDDDGDQMHDDLREIACHANESEEGNSDRYLTVCLVQSGVFGRSEGTYCQDAGDNDKDDWEICLEVDDLSVSVICCTLQNIISPYADI